MNLRPPIHGRSSPSFHFRRVPLRDPHRPLHFGSDLGRHDDVDDLAATARPEGHGTGGEGEQRVVAATADVDAGVEVRAALADDDLAGLDDLATEALDAQALGVRVAAVARGARALLVCHDEPAFVLREWGLHGLRAAARDQEMPVTLRRVSFWR